MRMESLDILRELVGFPTLSSAPNRALIEAASARLTAAGAQVRLIENEDGTKANLYATLGPDDRPGVLLSGHTDVVPVEGQDWTRDPFALAVEDGRAYGRGTADMKGFVASMLALAKRVGREQIQLETPLHLALSYDEEIGCVGVRSMIDMLARAPFQPMFCIVGEPTSLAVATGHKGKTALRVTCRGREAHSALAPQGLNAIYLATDMVAAIRELQAGLIERASARREGSEEVGFDVPYTTLHVGTISGGEVLNIVPNQAQFLAEIRNLPDDDPDAIVADLRAAADALLAPLRPAFPEAVIALEVINSYPGLQTEEDAAVVAFVKSLTGANDTTKVAFGTEGGLFSDRLKIPTVVCGPGSMAQGHRPDEFIELEQLRRCDAMLDALLQRLQAGL